MSTIIYHNHHIIPKHAGGTNDPSNIIRVNIAMHAFLHKLLYEEYGKQEDYLAYNGLLGIIGKDEIMKELDIIKARKTHETIKKRKLEGKSYSPSKETRLKISKSMKGRTSPNKGNKWTIEQKEKMSKARKGIPKSEDHKRKISEGNKNKKVSKETKEKLRNINLGKKLSKETKEKISQNNKSVKNWIIIYPNGERITIKCLSKFCKEHDLTHQNMSAVARGIITNHKGYKCYYASSTLETT